MGPQIPINVFHRYGGIRLADLLADLLPEQTSFDFPPVFLSLLAPVYWIQG